MDSGRPLFQKLSGAGTFKVFPDEIRYDPLFGKPGDKHWSTQRGALQDVTCEKKLVVYTLRFRTDAATYEAPNFTEADIVQIVSLIMPEKLQTDPLLRNLQQRRDDKALREQQQAYERQMADYQKSLQPEQMVRTYKHDPEKEFRKDAAHLARQGWMVQSQTSGGLKREGLVSIVTWGVAGKRKVGEITVVYTRQHKPLPMPTPPQQPALGAPTQASASQTAQPLPSSSEPPASPAPASPPDHMAQLEKLGELHQKGILTDEEFATKKADILARM